MIGREIRIYNLTKIYTRSFIKYGASDMQTKMFDVFHLSQGSHGKGGGTYFLKPFWQRWVRIIV